MRIDIISVLPELIESPLNHSIVKRAKENKIVEIYLHSLREYSTDKHRRVDDYCYGGGAGMVIQIDPVARCIESLKAQINYDAIIYTTPDGQKFEQKIANQLSCFQNIMILCGHYKGIDQRIRDIFITHEISIGDYVLTGGELAAAVITDCIVRLIPGAISDHESALNDSFQDNLLAAPVYTRPADYKGYKVPDILLSGNDKLIEEWRFEKSIERTKLLRPDLLQ